MNAPLETAALAALRAYMRQPGGPDHRSMCRVLDGIADEIDVSVAGWSNGWQIDTARTIRDCRMDLETDLERAQDDALEDMFSGVRADLAALTIRGAS